MSFLKVEVLKGPGVLTIKMGKAPSLSLPDWHHCICIGRTAHQSYKSGVFDSIISVASFGLNTLISYLLRSAQFARM
jgi:hypothetical protein